MKSILIVVYAHYVKLIIEGKKTVEIRKNKNLANAIKKLIAEQGGCWIYIYVAKSIPELYVTDDGFVLTDFGLGEHYKFKCLLNGKVVARFWCDKVEEIESIPAYAYDLFVHRTISLSNVQLMKKSCLSQDEMTDYLGEDDGGYAIHISKLEVFDRPRELYEFKKRNELEFWQWNAGCELYSALTKAPQNYCYIEGEE